VPDAASTADVRAATDTWFLRHGLPYFVPEQRREAKAALRLRRTVPLLVLIGLAAAAAGVALAWVTDQFVAAPATLVSIGLLASAFYALTALKARPIVGWALSRTFGSLRTLLPMMSRALPLLLLFVTFLFINAEVWQVASHLAVSTLWLVALLFGVLAAGFLMVRLPEEVDRADDDVDEQLLRKACRGTPLEADCNRLLDEGVDVARHAEVTGFERWNLVLVLLVIQAAQVLLLAVTVFLFFMIFGSLIMNGAVVETWTDGHATVVGPTLVQVSIFLASFSALYLTVSTVTDETYRVQFFGSVLVELERAVGMRAVYLALRADA
jgi:hypothetical protein